MITTENPIVKRHQNPFGIAARIIIYPLMFLGIWQHNVAVILLGMVLELANWTLMPPVEKTFPFIQNVVEQELRWLNASLDWRKGASLALLFAFLPLLVVGFWIHSITFIVIAFALLIAFQLLMTSIAKR